jgi:hypothetical protein
MVLGVALVIGKESLSWQRFGKESLSWQRFGG